MKNLLYLTIFSILLTSCGADNGVLPSGDISFGGSTATFTIQGDYLYTIDQSSLSTFDISNEKEIILVHNLPLNGNQLETIFPFDNLLYLGTTSGILIIDIGKPDKPAFLSEYRHVVSCDPVVTNGEFAYATLRSGNFCGQVVDQLQVVSLANIHQPQVVASYELSSPKGLALNGSLLYVCDDGIRVLDVSDHENINQLNHLSGIPANDVLYFNNQILVTADDGFYQYNVVEGTEFSLIGHFAYRK